MFINVRQRPHTVGVSVGADAQTSVPTFRGGLLHALHIIRLFAACEAGTRRGHYSGCSLLVLVCGRSNERPYRWDGVNYKAGGDPLCPSAVGGARARCPFICTPNAIKSHSNCRDVRSCVRKLGGGLLHALHIIRLFAGCEAGTRRGHYSGYSLLVLNRN